MMMKKIGEVCELVSGYAFKSSEFKLDSQKGLPIIRIQNVGNPSSDFVYWESSYDEKFLVNEEDILLSLSGSVKVDIWKGPKALLNQRIVKIIPKSCVNKKWIYWAIHKKIDDISNIGKKSIINNISVNELKKLDIYVPNLEQQNAIVSVLNKAQELIDKRKAQIEALDQLTQSVFLEMFGDPIKNTNQYKKEKLANLCIKITDGTHHSPPTVKEGIPYITAKHLNKGGLDFFKDPTYVSLEDHQKIYERCNPEKGDVLYIKDGATTGIAAINHYDFEFSMLSSLALIKVDFNKLNNYYLTHFLNNERVFRKITSGMNGGAIKRLTLKKINNIEVVVPPIELQNQFAEIIKKIEIQKELLQKSLEELENNFNSLMQRAFKGELFNDKCM
ncbi:type I restriction modification system, DNA specificity protein [Anoxybacillus flavithermus TNO-09.006]|uniref:restriction endonuclease subunit S n=2 Tax=Anoxybacillus flavithermus TaxID=33934 RepID=UPI0002A709A9|nr:restriction endonuclease subunit S [Anoxybacillus flavithermus]ELK23019.1 type I restriction modification system, DNA specificity protein [Anoxybacillus flavithermus TNO-09.006]